MGYRHEPPPLHTGVFCFFESQFVLQEEMLSLSEIQCLALTGITDLFSVVRSLAAPALLPMLPKGSPVVIVNFSVTVCVCVCVKVPRMVSVGPSRGEHTLTHGCDSSFFKQKLL